MTAAARTWVRRQQLAQPLQRILAHALAVVPALPQQLLHEAKQQQCQEARLVKGMHTAPAAPAHEATRGRMGWVSGCREAGLVGGTAHYCLSGTRQHSPAAAATRASK